MNESIGPHEIQFNKYLFCTKVGDSYTFNLKDFFEGFGKNAKHLYFYANTSVNYVSKLSKDLDVIHLKSSHNDYIIYHIPIENLSKEERDIFLSKISFFFDDTNETVFSCFTSPEKLAVSNDAFRELFYLIKDNGLYQSAEFAEAVNMGEIEVYRLDFFEGERLLFPLEDLPKNKLFDQHYNTVISSYNQLVTANQMNKNAKVKNHNIKLWTNYIDRGYFLQPGYKVPNFKSDKDANSLLMTGIQQPSKKMRIEQMKFIRSFDAIEKFYSDKNKALDSTANSQILFQSHLNQEFYSLSPNQIARIIPEIHEPKPFFVTLGKQNSIFTMFETKTKELICFNFKNNAANLFHIENLIAVSSGYKDKAYRFSITSYDSRVTNFVNSINLHYHSDGCSVIKVNDSLLGHHMLIQPDSSEVTFIKPNGKVKEEELASYYQFHSEKIEPLEYLILPKRKTY